MNYRTFGHMEQVDQMFAAEVAAMTTTFLAEHPEGVFVAYRMQQPQHMNATRLYVTHPLLLQKFGAIDEENQQIIRTRGTDKNTEENKKETRHVSDRTLFGPFVSPSCLSSFAFRATCVDRHDRQNLVSERLHQTKLITF